MISLPSSAKQHISRMKLSEIAGEVIFAGIEGPRLTEVERDILREVRPGGFVLFRKNLATVDGARNLCDDLGALVESTKGTKPFIAVDQEGGSVTRLPPEATQFPSMMAIGASRVPMNAFKIATLMATELRAIGINMDLAPVVDINNNPDNPVIGTRSFWDDGNTVAQFGAKFVEGLRQGRVLSVAKHFPGHGDTDVDSHVGLPVIGYDLKRLEKVELAPFRRAITAGVDGVMVSHVAVTRLDHDPTPSSLSKNVVSGLLRRKLSFPGLIMTDSLTMKAVTDRFGVNEAAIAAIEAGNDIVLACDGVRMAEEVQSALVSKAKGDKSFAKTLKRRAARIVATKDSKLRNFRKPSTSIVGCDSHMIEVAKVVERSVALVHDDGVMPILPRLRVASLSAVQGDELQNLIREELEQGLPAGQVTSCDRMVEGEPFPLGKTRAADVCLIFTQDLHKHPTAPDEVNRVIGLGKQTIVVAVNSPYDLNKIRRPSAYIATYSPDRLSIRVAVKALSGKAVLTGTPVPNLTKVG